MRGFEGVSAEPYATSLQHVLAELERIDLLVQVQVWRARRAQEADDQFQGLYISEQQVDALLARPAGLPRWATAPAPLSLAEVPTAIDQMAAGIAWRAGALASPDASAGQRRNRGWRTARGHRQWIQRT